MLPEDLPDSADPLGERVKPGLPESGIVNRLGRNLREIRDTREVPREVAGIGSRSWLECDLGIEEDASLSPPGIDILTAHGAITTTPHKTQH